MFNTVISSKYSFSHSARSNLPHNCLQANKLVLFPQSLFHAHFIKRSRETCCAGICGAGTSTAASLRRTRRSPTSTAGSYWGSCPCCTVSSTGTGGGSLREEQKALNYFSETVDEFFPCNEIHEYPCLSPLSFLPFTLNQNRTSPQRSQSQQVSCHMSDITVFTRVQVEPKYKTHTNVHIDFLVFGCIKMREISCPCSRRTPTFGAYFQDKKVRLEHGWTRYQQKRDSLGETGCCPGCRKTVDVWFCAWYRDPSTAW